LFFAIILASNDPDLDYAIIATNMHLLPEFGMSINEIERDGFQVTERIYMTFDGYTTVTMTKSLACFLLELPTALQRIKPDIILLAGDRGEQLMAAIAGVHMGIPVAHIQAGELSGNVDGIVRHSITKLAHIHFAANEEFANRVRKMGEQDFRVFVTGAPLVDELIENVVTKSEDLQERYRLVPDSPLILVAQHPVTDLLAYPGAAARTRLNAVAANASRMRNMAGLPWTRTRGRRPSGNDRRARTPVPRPPCRSPAFASQRLVLVPVCQRFARRFVQSRL
jgi:UDP-hydrolysing UDP-N-acetyl-D-glucosamine 2-epimerase